jgi:hypothetical protein
LLRLPAAEDNAAMQTEPPKAEPPKRKRRWFQFSLRTLMILTLICDVGSYWVTARIRIRQALMIIKKSESLHPTFTKEADHVFRSNQAWVYGH